MTLHKTLFASHETKVSIVSEISSEERRVRHVSRVIGEIWVGFQWLIFTLNQDPNIHIATLTQQIADGSNVSVCKAGGA